MAEKKRSKRSAGEASRIRELLRVLRKHKVLHGITPQKVRCVLEDMGPTYVKFGQIMSMRSDMLPEEYCKELQKLRAQVRPVPFAQVKALIEEDYQKPLDELFSFVDETPLGSASIAQVYRAVVKDTGQEVVIKAQRPGIYEMMKRDIPLLKRAVKLLRLISPTGDALDFNAIIDEMWAVAQEEMDFLAERDHIIEFDRLHADILYVKCPKPVLELTTKRVLVMQYISGIPIDHKEELERLGYDRTEIGLKLAESYSKQIFDDAYFHADPHPGNIWISSGQIVFLDLGMMGTLSENHRLLLRNAIIAVAQEDIQELEEIVLTLGDVKGKVNHSRLFSDIDQMVLKYARQDLGDIQLGKLIQELLDLAKRHEIGMPASITMLARGIMTMEGVLSACCPQVNLLQIITSHLMGSGIQELDLKKEVLHTGRSLYSIFKKGLELPTSLSNLAKMAVKGRTKVNLELVGSDEPLKKIDAMVNRLITCIISASLLMASSIICTTQMQPRVLGIPLLGALGFVTAVVLCIKLTVDTVFRRKK